MPALPFAHFWSDRLRPALKTFALSIFLAILGFSYALATHSDTHSDSRAAQPRKVAPRDVGTPLRFTNPFLPAGADLAFPNGGNTSTDPDGFDLGDAIGSSDPANAPFVTRYLTAAGGGLPYTFETKPNFDFVATNPPVPKLLLNGEIHDKFTFLGSAFSSAVRFNAILTDFVGTQRTGTFRINLFQPAPATPFRFAQDTLPLAQLGNPYFTNIDTIAPPAGKVVYSVNSGTVRLNGSPTLNANGGTKLEDIGLTLTPDGLLYGRPSFMPATGTTNTVNTVSFIAHATTDGLNSALSRTGTGADQLFNLIVENNTQATSEVLAMNCTLKTNSTTLNKDSLVYRGAFDPKGLTLDSLAGSTFTLRIAGAEYTGKFDAKGRIKSPGSVKTTALNVTVSPKNSTIQIKLSGATLSSATTSAGSSIPIVFNMEFKHYRTSDAVLMSTRTVGTKHTLMYVLAGTRGKSMAGGLQILNLNGQDKKFFDGTTGDPGIDGTAWFVRWIGVPRFSIDSGAAAALPLRDPTLGTMQTGSVSATIRIGDDSLGPVTATVNSNRLRFKAKSTDPGIFELILDGQRFIHSVQTNPLSELDTSIQRAIDSKQRTIFKFGMDVTGFSGETGRVIAPNQFLWLAQ